MNFVLDIWFWAFLVTLGVLGFIVLRFKRLDHSRRDLVTAFASRNDKATIELTAILHPDEVRVWRRLLTARAALEESEREQIRARRDLEDVLASLQDAVLVVDGEARLRFLNASAIHLFDVRIEDVLGAHLIEALPSFGLDAAMRAALRDGQASAHEVHLYAPKLREVFLRVAPIFSGSGQASGAVAIVQDLTEIRRLERVRRDFVANASHELRTPVANIRATAETMLHAPDDVQLISRFLPPLISEAERLSRLVSDLLDLARAESTDTKPFSPVQLNAVVENAIDRLREKAERREIILQWEPAAEMPAVLGDSAGLEQVTFNLLDNALAYTPQRGHVEIRLSSEALSARKSEGSRTLGRAILEFTDTGIGIPELDLPRIFERFYRVDKARSRAEGGTGLGLAIVKHIVENHGGNVGVESRVGEGSTFRVELPIQVEPD